VLGEADDDAQQLLTPEGNDEQRPDVHARAPLIGQGVVKWATQSARARERLDLSDRSHGQSSLAAAAVVAADPASTCSAQRVILTLEMTERVPTGRDGYVSQESLTLTVGCEFGLDSVQPAGAVLQVAPLLTVGVSVNAERWDTRARHHTYLDQYGNRCERFELERGASRISYEAEVRLVAPADVIEPGAREVAVQSLPDEVMNFIMPSRFCLPDELGHEAWQRFGDLAPGWSRVQTIVDYVHGHLEFVPGSSNPWTTAADAYRAGQGVCRDFAHLAITFCRALNIPARYVFGYIPAIDVPLPAEPMDFAAWFEAYLGGRWHTFDARNNRPRIGRVIVGRGRDAVDVALITSFGPLTMTGFEVRAEQPSAGVAQ
jgi:transglutaminase-like putative cysteine protease